MIRRRAHLTLAVTFVLAAIGFAGCGDKSESRPEDPVAAVRQALEDDGLTVTEAPKGDADQMLQAKGVKIGFFPTASKAENIGGPLESFLATGNQGEAKVTDNVVFLMTVTTGMTDADREAFDQVVSTSEVALDEFDAEE